MLFAVYSYLRFIFLLSKPMLKGALLIHTAKWTLFGRVLKETRQKKSFGLKRASE